MSKTGNPGMRPHKGSHRDTRGRGPGMRIVHGPSEPPPDQQNRVNLKAAQASSLAKRPKKITLSTMPWNKS